MLTERFKPCVDILHRMGCQAAGTALSIALSFDETGLLQYLEMLRDRRLAQLKRCHQLRHAGLPVDQSGENRPSGRIAQRVEHIAQVVGLLFIYFHMSI